MQIVIDIPEQIYKCACNDTFGLIPTDVVLAKAIKNADVLPKGHGRIGDFDALLEDMKATRTYDILVALDRAKTIIEADKAESEEEE